MITSIVPPRYLNIFLVVPVGLHMAVPVQSVIEPPYTYLGVIFILAGLALNGWSAAKLRKSNTTIDFRQTPTELVTEGPFRISRNPIFLSGVIVSLGIATLLGSLISFFFPVALLLILNTLYIPAEESVLEQTFDDAYRQYKQKVRRWI